MSHQRNVEGLRQSAQQRHEDTVRRTEEAIRQLIRAGRPINFKTVATVAQVSTAWLYQQPEIKRRIQQLREQAAPRPSAPPQTRASEASKDAIIATLRQRNAKLEEENRELRKQVEVAYGQLYQHQR